MQVVIKDDFLNEYTFECEVTYKRIKNIIIKFKDKDTLLVSSPKYISERKLIKEIESMSKWIIKNREKLELKNDYKLAKELNETDKEYYYYGIRYDLKFTCDLDKYNEMINSNNKFIIAGNASINNDEKYILAYTGNKKWIKDLSKYEKDIFFDKIKFYFSKELNELKNYNLPVSKIKIKTLKSAWGICHTVKKEITLNRRLVNHKEECLRYVIIHELCHLVHANHSKEFYKIIESVMPEYKRIRKELNYD